MEIIGIFLILGIIAFYEKRISLLRKKQIHFKDLENNGFDKKKDLTVEKRESNLNSNQLEAAEKMLSKYKEILKEKYSTTKDAVSDIEKQEKKLVKNYDGAFGD